MSINTIDFIENQNLEYLFCDLCRSGDCIYKFAEFKQYNGWYCRNCFELIDDDVDEENDDNYVITLRMLKTYIEVSNPIFAYTHFYMKMLCQEIRETICVEDDMN